MISVRVVQDKFEPNKTYPVITPGGIKELSGEQILARQREEKIILTKADYFDIINEIKAIKEKLNELQNGRYGCSKDCSNCG